MDEDRELKRAENKAFRLLGLRAHSEKELRAKLRMSFWVLHTEKRKALLSILTSQESAGGWILAIRKRRKISSAI